MWLQFQWPPPEDHHASKFDVTRGTLLPMPSNRMWAKQQKVSHDVALSLHGLSRSFFQMTLWNSAAIKLQNKPNPCKVSMNTRKNLLENEEHIQKMASLLQKASGVSFSRLTLPQPTHRLQQTEMKKFRPGHHKTTRLCRGPGRQIFQGLVSKLHLRMTRKENRQCGNT